MEIHYLAFQTITLSSPGADSLFQHGCPQTVVPCCLPYHSAHGGMDSAQPLWCTSVTLDSTLLLCVGTQKTLWNLIWSVRASGLKRVCGNLIWITFQATSKCGLDLICKNCISWFSFFFFLLSRLNSPQWTLWLQYFPAIHTTQWCCLSQLMSSYWLCVTASQMSKINENTLHFN